VPSSLTVSASAILALLAAVWLFLPVGTKLLHDWLNDDNYSHGILIVPLAAYFAWERRDRLAALTPKPSWIGLLVVCGSLATLVAGTLGAELFLTRLAILGTLVGAILFTLGWAYLRVLAFPLAFLLLMIPIPAIIFNQVAFPLQLFASKFGTAVMELFRVPVLREGNVIILAHTNLEVAEACSGIRSLISLLTLGIVYGYFTDSRAWVRVAIAASTVPIAIIANGLRVAGTGVLAHYYGREAADGFFHTFSGWLVFIFAFVMLFVVTRIVMRMAPPADDVTSPSPTGAPA
jgi:exosortase A